MPVLVLVLVLLSVDMLKPSGPVTLGFPLELPMLKSPNFIEAARAFGGLMIDTAPIINAAIIEIAKIVPIVVWFIIIVV